MKRITCFESDLDDEDVANLIKCTESGVLAYGSKVREFESKYSAYSKQKYNIGMSSASAAAYAIFSYLFEQYGPCDIYISSLGFTSPVWAAKKNGHNIIFVDIDSNLLFNMADYYIKRSVNPSDQQVVIMPVLYGGVSKIPNFDLFGDEIVVVDSAHCISPNIESDYVFFSFHPVKPICMSNGGLLATNNKAAKEYFEKFRNFGRETVDDSYDIVQEGFNFYMNSLNASLGLSQLNKCMNNVEKRKNNFLYLKNNISESFGYFIEHDLDSSYYLSTIILKNLHNSCEIRDHFQNNNIQATYHYPLLHKTKYYNQDISLPIVEELENRIVNLPIHQNLTKQELDKIIAVAKYWEGLSE